MTMICLIQESNSGLFLTEDRTWSSDACDAVQFDSVRETIKHTHRLNLNHVTLVLIRAIGICRLEEQPSEDPGRPHLALARGK